MSIQETNADGINIPTLKITKENDEFLETDNMVLQPQGNERTLKSMLFDTEEDKERYVRQNYAAKKIQNQFRQYKTLVDNTIFVQTRLRTKLAKKEYKQMKVIKKLSAQRTQVVMELYATEINYVSNLEKIVNCFMKPLRAIFDESKKGGITKENIDSIFCNIEDILVRHQNFLKKLKQVVDQWSNETLLSPLFENIHEYISFYIPYFNNYENSYDTIEKCMKVPAFEESIKMVEGVKKLERNDLKSLLILPVQRIPRYILYLKEILKHTWPSHPDYDGLKIEISKIDEDIKVLNRWKKFSESKGTIELLQNQIKRQNIEVKGKKYISEGQVLYQYSTMKESLKAPLPSYIYLFNDMLLLTKNSVSKFTRISRLSIIKAIPLNGIQIGDLSQTSNPEFQHYLSLTMQDHSILTLYLENNEQKDKWYDDFQRVLYHIHSDMSDLMTIGDDETSFPNSQTVSMNGDDEKDTPRTLHSSRLSEVDESDINSPTIKPFKINSAIEKKKDDYFSEEESPRSPDKKRDTTKRKKGKEKNSPDGKEKGFFSHMKNLFDEKLERGSVESLNSPVDKKLSKSNRKYKSKDSLIINNFNEGDSTIYGSYNSIVSETDGAFRPRSRSKKFSIRDNTFGSQHSVDKGDEDKDSTSTRVRDNTETSSILTNDYNPGDEHIHSNEIRNNNPIKEDEGELKDDDKSNISGRRNGQGNIIIDQKQLNELINKEGLEETSPEGVSPNIYKTPVSENE
ncbi:hypothetical protein H8356DRAFT_1713385 [Neocallimastix lanati (nom. inval.)]|jgi:hypothetical protein|uniref:Dbl homology domain-containing protein n=1 Tax=Neocallimastix californiae TaxID=1754190 RepID=A0A1Y2ELV9_9FUNG|nr:hypothetical protein H8356DRAFT_1713385 [Neocallimastix sp. JGI-2020a]ORY72553.1 hypothetical protein LY90DRAFT_667140 [Neocallimastix californiae]|eukprot:ORY72553.1 hypothetical protein LY90DRAFT_667140 [Neocallimastix californiae]